jgi:RNA polymerase sigma factor (sigma-70 family)
VLGKAYERWEQIATIDRPHAYVRRMLVNEHLSWRRRWRRRSPVDGLEAKVSPVDDGADAYAERDAMIALLDRLPARRRTIVVLRYYVGLSDAEIAAELGVLESTVRSQIARALSTLRIDLTNAELTYTQESR